MRTSVLSKCLLAAAVVGGVVWAGFRATADASLFSRPVPHQPAGTPRSLPPSARPDGDAGTGGNAAPAQVALPQPDRPEPARLPPDLTQTDPGLGLPGGGHSYCGPAAVSNWLMWWANHGFDRLAPSGDSDEERQAALVRKLANGYYMATSPISGTGPAGVLRGLDRWVRHAGYRFERLEYQGWRHHPKAFSTGIKQPQIGWLTEALEQGGGAWLHVGWYHRDPRYAGLRRRGGHWLTLVSIEPSGDAASLMVRDSAPYAGDAPALHQADLRPMADGWLFDGGRTAFRAGGYYAVGGQLELKRSDDTAVLDGAVILVLHSNDEGTGLSADETAARERAM